MQPRVFTNFDPGAPQIAQTPGATNTILEWCLTQLGWTIPFRDDANKIMCFQSGDPASTGAVFRVDDSNASYASASGYSAMTDVNTGTDEFSGNLYFLKSNLTGNWHVIADEYTAYVLVETTRGGVSYCCSGFGDYVPLDSTHKANAFIFASQANGFHTGLLTSAKVLGNQSLTSTNLTPVFRSSAYNMVFSPVRGGVNRDFYPIFIGYGYENWGAMPGIYSSSYQKSGASHEKFSNIKGLNGKDVITFRVDYYGNGTAVVSISTSGWR